MITTNINFYVRKSRPLTWTFVKRGLNLFYAHDGNKNASDVFFLALQNGVAAHYEYSPFGEITYTSKNTPYTIDLIAANPFRFSSEFYDPELDLIYYNYRHYSPALGRWLSRDPIEEQGGLNLYAFVGNKPTNNIDVQGNEVSESSCNKIITSAQKNNRRIRKTIEAIENNKKCKKPSISCECCTEPDLAGTGGYYVEGEVKICWNNNDLGTAVLNVLLHELIHAWNDCNGEGSYDCESSICDEIAAYLNSGQCQKGGLWRKDEHKSTKDCVVDGVLFSSEGFCPLLSKEALKKKINNLYGICNQKKMPF
ncbi:MAG: hypothetical protein K6B46_00060 [Opitutales bacterium]|nr:hypothetical protein [Opitutales bacterium]